MSKARVYQLAKQAGLSTAAAIAALRDGGFEVTNHTSSVERDPALQVLRRAAGDPQGAPPEPDGAKHRRRRKRRPTPEVPAGTVVIKKYGNRRLYSTDDSRYLTLEELEELVRTGKRVHVVDANTHEDITSQILTQILLEGGRAKRFPVSFLEQIIRLGDEALYTYIGRYLMTGLDMFLSSQRELERRYQEGFGQFNLMPFGNFGQAFWPSRRPSTPVQPEPVEEDRGAPSEDLQQLRRRLADLERQIESTIAAKQKR